VQARGWVLLRQVPLGFELWRRLNAFPPVVAPDEPKGKSGSSSDSYYFDTPEEKTKKPKLKLPK
jgi:hypothetical protein